MAVSVPGAKAQLTLLTATCPPKRMVSSRVSSIGVHADQEVEKTKVAAASAAADHVVVGAGLLQRGGRVDVPQAHRLVGAVRIGQAIQRVGPPGDGVRVVAGGKAGAAA